MRKTNPDPQTLGYYTGNWRTALITAKKHFQGHIALTNSFPSRENLGDIAHILSQVKEEMKDNGMIFSNGMVFLDRISFKLLTTIASDYSQDRDMNIVVRPFLMYLGD